MEKTQVGKDVNTNIEYIIVPKTEWEMLNKDLENMQDILRIQASELRVFKSNEYKQFERLQDEVVVNRLALWMQDKGLEDCPIDKLKQRRDFSLFIQNILIGCEKARTDFINRKVKPPK